MSGSSGNQFPFIFPDNIYKYLSGENVNLTKDDYDDLLRKINKFDACNNRMTLKTKLKGMVNRMGSGEMGNLKHKVNEALNSDNDFKELCSSLQNLLLTAPFMKDTKTREELNDDITEWCGEKFEENYQWLDDYNDPFRDHKDITLNGAKIILDNFNCMNDNGKIVDLNDAIWDLSPPGTRPTAPDGLMDEIRSRGTIEGGARDATSKLRLNMLKNNGVPVLFSKFPKSDYLTKRWRGENAEFGSSSSSSSSLTPSNLADCTPDFNENATKRHIKPWTPRERGSSASTLNAMSHLRRMASQPRITQVELGSLGPLLARGFMGGSMDGGAQLEVTFSDCPSENKKGDKLSVRQSTQYADLFKSVVQRLGRHNTVSQAVVDELKNDLEDYRRKECKLFQDAFRLANALKSQNNGSLSGDITSLDAFKDASDEVAKSETHLLGCLTKILTEACDRT